MEVDGDQRSAAEQQEAVPGNDADNMDEYLMEMSGEDIGPPLHESTTNMEFQQVAVLISAKKYGGDEDEDSGFVNSRSVSFIDNKKISTAP